MADEVKLSENEFGNIRSIRADLQEKLKDIKIIDEFNNNLMIEREQEEENNNSEVPF